MDELIRDFLLARYKFIFTEITKWKIHLHDGMNSLRIVILLWYAEADHQIRPIIFSVLLTAPTKKYTFHSHTFLNIPIQFAVHVSWGVHNSEHANWWTMFNQLTLIWGFWHRKQVSQAGISNCIAQNTVGCNYLSLPEILPSGPKTSHNPRRINVGVMFAFAKFLHLDIWHALCSQGDHQK